MFIQESEQKAELQAQSRARREKIHIISTVAWLTFVVVVSSISVTSVVVYLSTGAMADPLALFVAAITPGLIVPGAGYVNTSLQRKLETANEELLEANVLLQKLSDTDALTGTLNRRKFVEVAEREISLAARHGYASSLVLLDFDDFKKVNDKFGHVVGDQVLVQSVAMMQAVIRESDVLARFGGEEFILLLPHTSSEGAYSLTERLRQAVASNVVAVDNLRVPVTVSAGIVTCMDSTTPLDVMMSAADELLYESKDAGRNRSSLRSLATTDKASGLYSV